MHKVLTTALALTVSAPLVASAQSAAQASGAQASGSTQVQASTQVSTQLSARVPAEFSAAHQAALTQLYADARAHGLSERAISARVAEGMAKGASEERIVASASRMHAELRSSQEAMVRGGRTQPADDEVERGAHAMARGMTSAQLEVLTRHTPSDRSLVTALEVLTDLSARGVPVAQALAQVQTKIDQRASDAALRELSASAGLGLGIGAGVGRAHDMPPAANTPANGHAAPHGNGLGGTVGGTVGATVGGVIRKP